MEKREFIDNRMVHTTRERGIERVCQKPGDLKKGQGGKMHNTPSEKADFLRHGDKLTPRRG